MGWTVERTLLVLTFCCSAIAMVFGLGVQWNETTHVKADVQAITKLIENNTFVRNDVYAADQRRLTDAINGLTRAIRQDDDQIRPPSGRMFDR